MRVAVTGGGTGGHVFPALEVARYSREKGCEVWYFGSLRGMEAQACLKEGIGFSGFPSRPLYTLKSLKGWLGLMALLRSRAEASRALRQWKPDVVFSTGGYSSGPVVSAAQGLGIPTVLHEQNAVPARTTTLFQRRAFAVCTVFEGVSKHLNHAKILRTGMPLRREIRSLASGPRERDLIPFILILGGSQGALALNEAALGAALRITDLPAHWLNVAGKEAFESAFLSVEKLGLKDCFEAMSFLDAPSMAAAYSRATLAVCRSGAGTLSELAAYGIPSVTIPYPTSFADHQAANAAEFESFGATQLLPQTGLSPTTLADAVRAWLDDPERREVAAAALKRWDRPKATEEIYELLTSAASGASN